VTTTIRFSLSEGPAPQPAITDAERRLGHALPDEYTSFLCARNGGRPEANELPGDPAVGVTSFLGAGRTDDDDLVSVYDAYRSRVPAGMLPIAHAEGGNLLCLSLRDHDYGSIFFWDHELESEEGEPATEENVHLVAGSIPELLGNLAPLRPEHLPDATVEHAWIDPDFLDTLRDEGEQSGAAP